MPVEHWFSTPIFAYDLTGDIFNAVQQEISLCINTAREVSVDTKTQWGDTVVTTFDGTNDIETYNLTTLNLVMKQAINEYVKTINYRGPELVLTESWFNFYKSNGFQFDHSHPTFRVAGTYYYKSNGNDGSIRFQNPNPYAHAQLFPADGTSVESVSYAPKPGRLLLFPSWLVHRVNLNNTDNERISIAMNFK